MRYYSSVAAPTTLSGGINNVVTSMTVAATTGFPATTPYTLVLDPDTASEEIITVTAVAGTTLTITRGQDGSSATSHDSGAVVKHMVTARDLAEPQAHIDAASAVHGISGNVVGTSDTQTLTNKTLTSPTISGSGSVTAASLSVSGTATLPASTTIGTVSATELGYLDGVTSGIQTQIGDIAADITALDSSVSAVQATANAAAPAGVVQAYLGTSAPTGWLFCNGAAVSRTTYSALFTLFGTRYGAGDGSTTFNLPDFRSQFLRGAADVATLSGTVAGANTHTHTASTALAGGHSHTYSGTVNATAGAQRDVSTGSLGAATYAHQHSYSGTTDAVASHSHTVTVDSGSNIPSNFGINWIVKA